MLYIAGNFLLLVAVLVYFGREPIRAFFDGRRSEIQKNLDEAGALLSEAEARNAQLQRQLLELDDELEQIRGTARQRAEAERVEILADAEASAERILNDARAAVDQEIFRAREQLRSDAAQLAIELASERLRGQITAADGERLIDEFIDRVGTPGTPGRPDGAATSGPPGPGAEG